MTDFFGGRGWYGIPCSAVEKDGDPTGRVVHDYGFYIQGSYSVNAAHSDTSVRYDWLRRRVLVLEKVRWYVKADLKSGFRQFGTHPSDWRFQVYCNGRNEHYIDLACPFGKTNSTLEFCPPVKLFAISAGVRWSEIHPGSHPRLSSYVDDIYGGLTGAGGESFEMAFMFSNWICDTGEKLTLVFNRKLHKTPLPAIQQVILGCLYDSTCRRVKSTTKKVNKYISRINEALETIDIPVKKVMSLHGNLVFAAAVAPFGRPFLAALSNLVVGKSTRAVVQLTPMARMCLRI